MVKHITMILFGYQIQASFKSQFEKKVKVFSLKITADLLGQSKKYSHSLLSHSCYTEK